MSSRLDVSVIMPFLNAGEGIASALNQLAELEGDTEIILVDDGSTDESTEFAARFAAARPDTRLIRFDQNQGVANARNAALQQATRGFVWFADWDDEWDSSIVRTMYDRAIKTRADVVVCRSVGLGFGNPRPHRKYNEPFRRAGVFDQVSVFEMVCRGQIRGFLWSKLIRREIIPENPFPPMKTRSDITGFIRLIPRITTLATVDAILFTYISRQGSLIVSDLAGQLSDINAVITAVDQVGQELGISSRSATLAESRTRLRLNMLHTATRSPDTSVVSKALREYRNTVPAADIVALLRARSSLGLAALAAKVSGRGYVAAYRLFRTVKSLLKAPR